MGWESYDAVILAAFLPHGGRSLDALVRQIDVTNHDVPAHEVVGPGLGRLVAAGLLQPRTEGFELTGAGRELVEDVSGGLVARIGVVRARLVTVPVAGQADVLTEEDWRASVQRYTDAAAARRLGWRRFWRKERKTS